MVPHGDGRRDGRAHRARRGVPVGRRVSSRPCCSPSTSATRTSRSACCATGRSSPPVARRRCRAPPPTSSRSLLDGLLHLDDASFGDVDAIACASVVSRPHRRRRVDRRPPGAAADARRRRHRPARRPRRAPGEVGRRPPGQRARRRPPVRHAGGRRRLRDRHDVRLRRRRRRVRRRRDRPGLELGPRGARGPDRQAAADRAAGAGSGDRPRHGERDAVGHGLRVPGARRRAADPDPARAGRPGRRRAGRGQGDPDRRPVRGALGRATSRASTPSIPT